ncbi:uncharacterized protein LOC131883951 isoform X1 [Tigriopus californicus]|uniref:uncharacterized protein LOC131883951 isoform X1 n=1 Tax=Tigriopus californicus TaxID=6832 RepID=UPI0027DA5F55|nr:uncharacterized protein LOC131883951 isoform X1 [Tigriopus californicus]
MGRSKPKEFRYQRINFDDDDDEDNSDLARALGPSPGAQRATCAQCVRGFCIVTTILATTAFIATAILFGSAIFPSGPKIFANSTDLGTHDGNVTVVTNGTQIDNNQFQNETISNTTSTEINSNFNSSTTNETPFETNSTQNQSSNSTTKTANSTTKAKPQPDPSTGQESTENKDHDKKPQTSNEFTKDDSEVKPKAGSRKLLGLSSTEKGQDVTTSDTIEGTEMQSSSFQTLLERFDRQELVAMVALICFTAVGISISIFCILCFLQRRRRAKRNHFSRLINDLNATEKFTIDAISDDEEVSN